MVVSIVTYKGQGLTVNNNQRTYTTSNFHSFD